MMSLKEWDETMPNTKTPPKRAKKAVEAKTAPAQGVGSLEEKNAPKPKIGRPSKYTPELAAEICERLSNGEPLRQICRDAHMPAWQKIYEWMARDENLSGAIARAREVGQDAIAEQIWIEMLSEPERILSEGGGRIDSGYVQLIKARADVGLKLLAKWNPKRYGDRVSLAGDAENPLQVKADVTVFDAIIQNLEAKRQTNLD
jgi:hypothetical protein